MVAQAVLGLFLPRTSLVGREREVLEIWDLVLRGSERLVTLTGVGGCGKTRLALEVARRLREAFPDGVWLVELAGVSDARGVLQRTAGALAIRGSSDGALAAALEDRTLLLILDNCEHLVEACAELADQLLARCANLRILATSREPLLIPGERQRRVAPLATPPVGVLTSPEVLTSYPAAQLFVERAGVAAPGFQLTRDNAAAVAQICTLLDGIPLALELAAAQARVLAPAQIAARLSDCFRLLGGGSRLAPTRQQTLRASLDWSHALLGPTEQVVFRRLAVLAGSWSLEAAEAVCTGEGLAETDVLAVLTRLVDKSLVVTDERDDEVRYRLLEPVRQYAARRLEASGEVDAVQARQAAFCIALAERAEPELQGPRQVAWLRRLDAELDNLRAVLARAEQVQDATTILRTVGPLYYFLWLRRHLREGQHWFEVGLASAKQVPPAVRARGLFGLTLMLSLVGENTRADAVGQQAIAAYRHLGDAGALALVQVVLAQTTLARGDLPAARRLAENALAHARASGAGWALGHALILLGQVVHREGDSNRAVRLQQDALGIFEADGDAWSRAYALASLASLREARPSVARVAALAGVRWAWELGQHAALASALEYLALYGGPQAIDVQVRWFAAAHALRQSTGTSAAPGERDQLDRQLARARAELGEVAFQATWKAGHAAATEDVVALAVEPADPNAPTFERRDRGEQLTAREREVAMLLMDGATDREIAQALTITEGTAGLHVHHILAKLGLRSRAQVADRVAATGLGPPLERHGSATQRHRNI